VVTWRSFSFSYDTKFLIFTLGSGTFSGIQKSPVSH